MKGRFARIPEHALKANLSLQAHRVLIAIALHANPAGWAWPSLETIDALAGTSRHNTCAAIDQLEKAGVVRRESGKGGRSNPTRYQIVGMPEKTGSKSDPLSPENRVLVSPPLAPETGSDVDDKQGLIQTPEQTNRTEGKDAERARACEEGWKEFWAIHPGRGGYPDPETPARREFEAAVARGVAATDIIAGAEVWTSQIAENGTEPRFVKSAKNWLRDEGWLDRPRPPVRRRPVAGMA